jgi:hypothetical protein
MIERERDPKFTLIEYDGAYKTWEQIAGYFDGDGTVYIDTTSKDVLRFSLVWVDNCREQIGQLRHFLVSQRISSGEVLWRGDGTYTMQISSPRFVLQASKLLIPHCFKKRFELQVVIDYYENRISGTAALEGFNTSVTTGVRIGRIRPLMVLPRYGEGKRNVATARGRKSAEAWARKSRIRANS